MKHTIILNLLLIALLLVSCNSKKDSDKQVQYVKTITIADASKFAEVNFPGRTKAIDDINVAFRVSGPISRILVHDGDHVSKGQVIATMDPRDYQVQLNATKAEYEQVKADAERIIALYQEGNTTASNYDKARYGLTHSSFESSAPSTALTNACSPPAIRPTNLSELYVGTTSTASIKPSLPEVPAPT